MELKQEFNKLSYADRATFNWTNMELKLGERQDFGPDAPFNWTNMELKQSRQNFGASLISRF